MASEKTEIGTFTKAVDPVKPSPARTALNEFLNAHNVTVTPPPAPAQPTEEPQPQAEAAPAVTPISEKAFEEALEAAEKAPELTYEERLAKVNVTLEKAQEIVDSILIKNFYQETFPLTSKVSVTFRTRLVANNDALFASLEDKHPGYTITLSNHITKHNLAASLASIGKQIFPATPEGLKQAMAFIEKLPAHAFTLLVDKLRKFDAMLTIVLDEGAIENF